MQWGKHPLEDFFNYLYEESGPVIASLGVTIITAFSVVCLTTFIGLFIKAVDALCQ